MKKEQVQEQPTKEVFCAKCQQDTTHTGAVDPNGEIVLTCTVCGGFIKLPSGLSRDEMEAILVDHKDANKGQVSVEQSHKALDELFGEEEAKPEQTEEE